MSRRADGVRDGAELLLGSFLGGLVAAPLADGMEGVRSLAVHGGIVGGSILGLRGLSFLVRRWRARARGEELPFRVRVEQVVILALGGVWLAALYVLEPPVLEGVVLPLVLLLGLGIGASWQRTASFFASDERPWLGPVELEDGEVVLVGEGRRGVLVTKTWDASTESWLLRDAPVPPEALRRARRVSVDEARLLGMGELVRV